MNAQRKCKQLDWTAEMDQKFETLKQNFSNMPIRSYPRYDIKNGFELTTDFSSKNIGGILSQEQEGQE